MRQFGPYVQRGAGEHFISSGIGPHLDFKGDSEFKILLPTHTFDSGSMEVPLGAGMVATCHHAPGETDDQLVVTLQTSLSHKTVLLAADNVYEAFPNLYAIRGSPHRDVMQWANSLELMARLDADVMVPSHTAPVHGRDEVRAVLDAYHDAVQFVHDQTVRLMNRGMTPDEIVSRVSL